MGNTMTKRGVFIGRFQPFHKGHLNVVERILSEMEELIIVIGSSQISHRITDPFTAGERILMIKTALKKAGIEMSRCWIIPVPDVNIHKLWVSQIINYVPGFIRVYSNEPLTCRLFIEEGFEVDPAPFYEREIYSATEVRNRIFNGENWEELVPESVSQIIKDIDGIERMRALIKTDKRSI